MYFCSMKTDLIIKVLLPVFALSVCTAAYADEGMWMINGLTKDLVSGMQRMGLELDGNDIYDSNALSVTDAIVAIDFMGTGSVISPDGLMITNHHVAYGDIHSLSTTEHNYLREGFLARSRDEEVNIPGRNAYFLRKVIDVTDETLALIEEETAAGRNAGSRRLSYLMEKKYKASTGLDASLASMWSGSKYYMSLYEVYPDVRLVAAPPESIAAFGGDIDNWEWPQHKCDFALYRIYTGPDGKPAEYSPENIPLHPEKYLEISDQGYRYGDFAMVLGYPGRTDRYCSSAKLDFIQNLSYPISNRVRASQMAIIKRWMDADPEIRLKYADKYFSLSNTQENHEGLVQCCKRFNVIDEKKKLERKVRDDECQELFAELAAKYAAVEDAEKDIIYYRETIVRGTALALLATRLKNIKDVDISKEYENLDMRVEKELMQYAVNEYYTNVSAECWGPYQTELARKFNGDWDAVAGYLWKDGVMTKDDPIFKFFSDITVKNFNDRIVAAEEGVSTTELGRRYIRAMYKWREAHNILQYPDANSTLRLTYGKVSTFKRDGKRLPWMTVPEEILAKEEPGSFDFSLIPEWKSLLQDSAPDCGVDFITDNDITGGNSGSPVLNGRGQIIGLAFDGNKESLAGDVSWTRDYNRCVNVDIRFVLWTLRNYMHADDILKEINK